MKKHFYILAALLALSGSSYCLQAQTFGLGFEAGAGASGTLGMPNPTLTPLFAYRAGVFLVEKTGSNRYSETNIAFQTTGMQAAGLLEHYAGSARNVEFRAQNLEMTVYQGLIDRHRLFNTPVSFIYKLGVYIGYALGGSGRIAYDAGAGALLEKDVDNIFRDETFSHNGVDYPFTAFRRWDFGVRLGVDIVVKRYSLRCFASIGGANIHPGGLDKTVNNRLVMVALGYTL